MIDLCAILGELLLRQRCRVRVRRHRSVLGDRNLALKLVRGVFDRLESPWH